MKRVLVLGAGLVARPMVRYLLDHGFAVTVASRTVSKAKSLLAGHGRGVALAVDASDEEALDPLVASHDLTVSLLPYTYHVRVAGRCLAHGRPLVTTSYVSDAMRALDAEAKGKGVLLLNEIGLDPGIDHMSAMKIIHRVRSEGAEVVSFRSYCGGLPAPDARTTPWGYKFSWSPRGVLLAGRNAARWLEDGKEVEVPASELFAHHWPVTVGMIELEGYPNRDSLPYKDLYGLHGAHTLFRGTLRYPGWCRTMKALADLGYFDLEEMEVRGLTYRGLMTRLVPESRPKTIEPDAAARLGLKIEGDTMHRLRWLGLFSDEPIPAERGSPLDILAHRMEGMLRYAPGERDMIVLHHQFGIDDGRTIHSTLIDYGVPGGETAMARTVSIPAAIAARLILEGKIRKTGVQIPVSTEVYEPVLEELDRFGIRFREETFPAEGGPAGPRAG